MVGPRAIRPDLAQRQPAPTVDPDRSQQVGGGEPGAEHQHVGRVLPAVGGAHPGRGHLADPVGDQHDVRPGQRRQPVAAEQHPLAAELVVRHQSAAQLRVGHLPAQLRPADAADQRGQRPGPGQGHAEHLGQRVVGPSETTLQHREPPGQPAAGPAVAVVEPGQHPRCGPLEHGQSGDLVDQFRHELDRARAGADHRDPAAGQRHLGLPLRRVHHRTAELVQPDQIGPGRSGELADRRHQHVRLERLAGAAGHPPASGAVVVVSRDHPGAEPDLRQHAEPVGDLLQVGQDLGLLRVPPGPVRVRRERQRVQVRRHVAGATGVGVLAPDAADLVTLLEQGDQVATAQQLGGQADPAETGADHQHTGSLTRTGPLSLHRLDPLRWARPRQAGRVWRGWRARRGWSTGRRPPAG